MGWVDSGDIKTIFLQGVIPLVVGISLCVIGALYILGVINFTCCKRHDDQVAPVIMTEAGRVGATDNDNSTTRGRAYGPVACKTQLYGMEPKERKAVLEAVFSSCCTHKENVEVLAAEASEEEVKMERGELDLDTRCACAICLREYGMY